MTESPEHHDMPPHEHLGDAYDREHCVWTRADGERCGMSLREAYLIDKERPEALICGAWGGCTLPAGHNQGRADIPESHQPPDTRARAIEALRIALREDFTLPYAVRSSDYADMQAVHEAEEGANRRNEEAIGRLLDAVAPIIRADERRIAVDALCDQAQDAVDAVLAALRAKVEGLGHPLDCSAAVDHGPDAPIEFIAEDCDCFQRELAALFDEVQP